MKPRKDHLIQDSRTDINADNNPGNLSARVDIESWIEEWIATKRVDDEVAEWAKDWIAPHVSEWIAARPSEWSAKELIKWIEERVESRIRELHEKIDSANREYFLLDIPSMPDEQYDRLMRELIRLEQLAPHLSVDSPTGRVGAPPSGKFEEITHHEPLLSLSNAFSFDEFEAWYKRTVSLAEVDELELVCEPKIDGLAVTAVYEDGKLVRAATRGDGLKGEDVTANLRTIHTVPSRLRYNKVAAPAKVELRGEVYFPLDKFEAYNREREEQGLSTYVNPRNGAAGSLRQLDPAETARRPLGVFFYAIGWYDNWDLPPKDQWEVLGCIRSWGCPTIPAVLKVVGIDGAKEYLDNAPAQRKNLDFAVDGVVLKVNSLRLQQSLGVTRREPRWATAFKFTAEKKVTKLKQIRVNVGRTGVLTPWAELEPVMVGGVEVRRATLHNRDELARKDVREGDSVVVQRAGDVIPQIVGTAPGNKRVHRATPFKFPANCPECDQPVVSNDAEVAVRCVNADCPAQFERLLEHFASRNAMDIGGLGERMAQILARHKFVRSLADIYHLGRHREQILEIKGIGEKKLDLLLEGIEASKKRTLMRLIFALGIGGVGEENADAFARRFKSLARFSTANREELEDVDGIGPVLAESVLAWMANQRNAEIVQELQRVGVVTELSAADLEDQAQPLNGHKFVITGTLSRPRNEFATHIKQLGGKLSGTVSKEVYVVIGSDPGSKADKARKRGLKILDESGLVRLLEQNGGTNPF